MHTLTRSHLLQSSGLMSKARRFAKGVVAKVGRPKASDRNTSERAMKEMQSQFAEAKSKLVLQFGQDDESAITLVVWDFGGQKVSHVCCVRCQHEFDEIPCTVLLF